MNLKIEFCRPVKCLIEEIALFVNWAESLKDLVYEEKKLIGKLHWTYYTLIDYNEDSVKQLPDYKNTVLLAVENWPSLRDHLNYFKLVYQTVDKWKAYL